jgi:hypothetical protein
MSGTTLSSFPPPLRPSQRCCSVPHRSHGAVPSSREIYLRQHRHLFAKDPPGYSHCSPHLNESDHPREFLRHECVQATGRHLTSFSLRSSPQVPDALARIGIRTLRPEIREFISQRLGKPPSFSKSRMKQVSTFIRYCAFTLSS